ncbi:MAG TPA: hypothetical protein DCE44_12970 [Verrucomicrobiales bacterium]|nr:hypothetical protein [Verrucomicrobiales bacterium]
MSSEKTKHDPGLALAEEAAAFDQRIAERQQAGYVPDIRRAVKCEYFYKSFWRDPHFARLYLGGYLEIMQGFLERYGKPGMRLLDVGCGPGYFSLEFARLGYHVTGIDIAPKAIDAAQRALDASPRDAQFGSLEYGVRSLEEMTGTFDAISFTGVIHHFSNPDEMLRRGSDLLEPNGLLICLEPCHERWREDDAAVVALIRGLLSATGHWYEPDLFRTLQSPAGWQEYTKEVQSEYLTERDPHERGQSPNDNASSGEEILASLRRQFTELEYRDGVSFIYRLLGGLRGPDEVTHPLANLIAEFDRFAVGRGILRPNAYLWAGRKLRQT